MNQPKKTPTAAATPSCSMPRCRRRPARRYASGLCASHHQELVEDRESEFALTGGRWVAGRHGIRIWRANASA